MFKMFDFRVQLLFLLLTTLSQSSFAFQSESSRTVRLQSHEVYRADFSTSPGGSAPVVFWESSSSINRGCTDIQINYVQDRNQSSQYKLELNPIGEVCVARLVYYEGRNEVLIFERVGTSSSSTSASSPEAGKLDYLSGSDTLKRLPLNSRIVSTKPFLANFGTDSAGPVTLIESSNGFCQLYIRPTRTYSAPALYPAGTTAKIKSLEEANDALLSYTPNDVYRIFSQQSAPNERWCQNTHFSFKLELPHADRAALRCCSPEIESVGLLQTILSSGGFRLEVPRPIEL